jgi:hypothetical protein
MDPSATKASRPLAPGKVAQAADGVNAATMKAARAIAPPNVDTRIITLTEHLATVEVPTQLGVGSKTARRGFRSDGFCFRALTDVATP